MKEIDVIKNTKTGYIHIKKSDSETSICGEWEGIETISTLKRMRYKVSTGRWVICPECGHDVIKDV